MGQGEFSVPEGDFQDDVDFSEDDSDETQRAEQTLPPLSDLLKSTAYRSGRKPVGRQPPNHRRISFEFHRHGAVPPDPRHKNGL
jgi:hypothetical protein